ncbi:CCA tRNA nucleotidyltransferase [Desulfobacterota bacterium M19]
MNFEYNRYLRNYPGYILRALARQTAEGRQDIFFAGGPVRDWLLSKEPFDLDITLAGDPRLWANGLARRLQAVLVPLSETEGVYRVVKDGLWLDISTFRNDTKSIEEDLKQRDFSINAMALRFDYQTQNIAGPLIDPLQGLADLERGIVRHLGSDTFQADPLRLLRAFRFAAGLDFKLAAETIELTGREAPLLNRAAPERISLEIEKIMVAKLSGRTIEDMAACGLLWQIFPELLSGVGMRQPASHHLDVFGHSLEALKQMEMIIAAPEIFFTSFLNDIKAYLDRERIIIRLKLAALLHDIGKPPAFVLRDGRFTFYNHDQMGARIIEKIGRRLRWSSEDRRCVALLIKEHMRPFHLNNARHKTGISRRACLKLIKAVGPELIGLFLLTMADSLAGQGVGKPSGMEADLASLFTEIETVNQQIIQPVLSGPPLIDGYDLIRLGMKPGPFFGRLFQALEVEMVKNPAMSKAEARQWAAAYFNQRHHGKNVSAS